MPYFEKSELKKDFAFQKEYKCMNCRKPITSNEGGIYGRRFCSEKCRIEYLRDVEEQ